MGFDKKGRQRQKTLFSLLKMAFTPKLCVMLKIFQRKIT